MMVLLAWIETVYQQGPPPAIIGHMSSRHYSLCPKSQHYREVMGQHFAQDFPFNGISL